jgi:hypothetical protein
MVDLIAALVLANCQQQRPFLAAAQDLHVRLLAQLI